MASRNCLWTAKLMSRLLHIFGDLFHIPWDWRRCTNAFVVWCNGKMWRYVLLQSFIAVRQSKVAWSTTL